MASPKPCSALLRTHEGVAYECAVANLSERGAFLRTGADIAFRQRVHVDLLGLHLDAEVLFVSATPPGVVVAWQADVEAQDTLQRALVEVEILPEQGMRADGPWDEDTAAGVTLDPMPDIDISEDLAPHPLDASGAPIEACEEEEPPRLGTGDLVPLAEEESDAAVDPMLFAAAMIDDGVSSTIDELPILEPVDTGEVPFEPVPGLDSVSAESSDEDFAITSRALDALTGGADPGPPISEDTEAGGALDAPAATRGLTDDLAPPGPAADLAEPELPVPEAAPPIPSPSLAPRPSPPTPAAAATPTAVPTPSLAPRPRGPSVVRSPAAAPRPHGGLPPPTPPLGMPAPTLTPRSGGLPPPTPPGGLPAPSATPRPNVGLPAPTPRPKVGLPPPTPPLGMPAPSRTPRPRAPSVAPAGQPIVPPPPAAPPVQAIVPPAPEPAEVIIPPAPSAAPRPRAPSVAPVAAAPAPAPAAPAAPAPAPAAAVAGDDEVTRTLPELLSDGYTVRFGSPEAYRTQFRSNLQHGGLVVKAQPLAIGTQRMLALDVPGASAYTVSARVVFHEPGKLGFMLDSLALHKTHLAGLAG